MYLYRDISYFKGLSSLRFFASYLVVMHHSETIRAKHGLFNLGWLGLFKNGGNAVTFFFVLSGFLITYLLLKENLKTGTVCIRKFYLRRILRIWPLYFLLVIIGTIMAPVLFDLLNIQYSFPYTLGQTWYYYLFFLPGLVTFFYGHHLLEPLWSIGVEEVFYLFWAPLFRLARKHLVTTLVIIIVIKLVLNIASIYYVNIPIFSFLIETFRFEAMALGGLGAYFVFNRTSSIDKLFIYSNLFKLFLFSTIIVYLCLHSNINNSVFNAIFKSPVLGPLVVNFLFLYLIIGVSVVNKQSYIFNNKLLSYLGDISYGIYMYHLIVIFGIIQILKPLLRTVSPVNSVIIFYITLTLLVIIISSLSKLFFEDYFLKLKNKNQ